MIRSMTGFGQARQSIDGYGIHIDLKSVNHRYQEIVVRLPREYFSLEDALKKVVQSRVKRGRVDLFVTVEKDEGAVQQVEIDWDLVAGYVQAAHALEERFRLGGMPAVSDLLHIPELVRLDGQAVPHVEEVADVILACARDALESLMAMREREGLHLGNDLLKKIAALETIHGEIARLRPGLIEQYRHKLREKIGALLEDGAIDEHRIGLEVALVAERSDIDEELKRLESHFQQFRHHLEQDEPVGKKLDFLVQEMNREVNTIGAKSIGVQISRCVVDMKAELEKIREQVQNIE